MRAAITVPDVDPEDVMAVWRDIAYRFTWDDRCAQNTCHSVLGEDPALQNEIGYYEGKAPPPLSNRDFLLQSGWRARWKGEPKWLYMNRSVQHPEYPEVKVSEKRQRNDGSSSHGRAQGIVRGISHVTGVQIEQASGGLVTITYVTNGDVGGWIPKPVTNWVVTKAGLTIVSLMRFAFR